jgi:hypothetical protein
VNHETAVVFNALYLPSLTAIVSSIRRTRFSVAHFMMILQFHWQIALSEGHTDVLTFAQDN